MPTRFHGNTCARGSRLRALTLAAALLGAVAVLTAGCGDQGAGAADPPKGGGGGVGSLNPFAHRVELDLPAYLQQLAQAPLGLPDVTSANGGSLREQVRTFYQRRQNQPAWFADGRVRDEANQLVDFLAGLDAEGLTPADYRPQQLQQALEAVKKGDASVKPEDVEVGLTWAALLAASDLHDGRVTPDTVGDRWKIRRDKADLPATLQKGLEGGKLVDTLRALDPPHPQFAALLQAMQRYRQIAIAGGWPEVPKGPVLKEGQKGDAARLQALAKRLQAEGFLAAIPPGLANVPPGGKAPYSKELAEGVRNFQATRTVEVDGSLGPETQEELNVPVLARMRQIALNLERWRWVPDDFGQRAVVVNLPGYNLDVEEQGRQVMSMRVVVGDEGWETPVFSDRIRFLTLNPYWNVPPGIFAKEIQPKMASDPGYLYSHDMEWTENRDSVRQRPGPENPLGKVKFMFPNKYDIYLHDTPAKALFDEADRNGSHGCIRVERPLDLADYLMQDDPKWGGGQLRAAIDAGEQRDVKLPQPVPVYLLYFTAMPGSDGNVAFFEDIYDIDSAQAQAQQAVTASRGSVAREADQLAQQQKAGAEAVASATPHGRGAAAWLNAHRPGAFRQTQGKPRQKP
ncbi:MAG TPA: L,D-transpeptidase family protein [Thermoanaerobaculia bacterium]|nr:L,D-transpeptidase family protein [Thermoanaerobaculia bacterium]